jgi:hypothetical protein
VPQNRWEHEDGAGHMSRPSRLVRVEVSQARVFHSGFKTGGGMTQMVHVASSRRLRRVEDGKVDLIAYVRTFYHNFIIFYVLSPRCIFVL